MRILIFIWIIKKATNDKKSDAHAELYHCLLKMFVDTDTNKDALEKSAGLFKPSLIDAGFSCYSRNPDYKRFKEIADQNKSWLMADMAAGDVPFSFEYCDVVTGTVHRTLRGHRAGIIFSRKGVRSVDKAGVETLYDIENEINMAVVPGLQAKSDEFKNYQKQVIENANAVAWVTVW